MQRKFVRVMLLAVAIAIASMQTSAEDQLAPATQPVDHGNPVTLPGARQYDFTSRVNGLTYRVMIYTSAKLKPKLPQPAIYILDGNYYFASACDAMAMNELTGVVVGIGYPTDDRDEVVRRRSFDLSLPTTTADAKHGGGDAFLRIVKEEVEPLVMTHCKIDPARQALFGHSLGGLIVLRQLFRDPQAYSAYIAASPSIWWHDREVLGDEDAFCKKVRAASVHLKLLITSAEDEEYHGTDPALLEKADRNGMVSNASNLAARLGALDPRDLVVARALFPQETHRSGAIASLVRSLNFVFKASD